MLNQNTSVTLRGYSYVLYDLLLIVGVFFIPTISHVAPLPLYLFEPMRIMIFSLLLFFPYNNKNAIVMAATLPLVSFLISSHPVLLKAMLLSLELVLNVVVFQWLTKRINIGLSVIISIIASKIVYYLMKAGLLLLGLLKTELITTGLGIQLIVTLSMGLLFQIVFSNEHINKWQKR